MTKPSKPDRIWRQIVGYCNHLSGKVDAYYMNERQRRRAAKVVKDLRFNNPVKTGYFKKDK